MRDKKALIILAENVNLKESGKNLERLVKKGAYFASYTAGDVLGAAVAADTVEKITTDTLEAAIEKGVALMVCDLGSADACALDTAMGKIFDLIDRRTTIAIVSKGALLLYGLSINAKAGDVSRVATAQDIVPTLAYIADFSITDGCTGAILYQGLKTPDLKKEEIEKYKEALSRMEAALARDNREPWEKHDCA